MGAVYKARQPRLDRIVALKILAPEKQNDPQFAERFEREARALARLNHPNIVTVYDFGEVQGRFYLLMEFVDGLTLRQLLQNGKMTPAEALNIVPKICEALQYAHGQGIVHRDIKPENILLDKQGRVKIADFGIAKMAGLESKDFSLTGARDVMGTPHYMAPEQMEKPQTVDHRADIYSLGVVFYEMLTGELPLGKFAPPSQKVQVDVRLDEVVLHALEKEPARRYQQASQVKTDVENVSKTVAGAPMPLIAMATQADVSDKAILPAFLLAFFFGVFGAHRFYVGKFVTACLQLLLLGSCILWIVLCANDAPQPLTGLILAGSIIGCFAWNTIDWLLLACKAFRDGKGRRMTNWTHARSVAPTSARQTPAGKEQSASAALSSVAPTNLPSAMIAAPAIALMMAGLLKISAIVFHSGLLVSGSLGILGGFLGKSLLGTPGYLPFFSAVVLFEVIPGVLMLFGGYQMLQRRSYAWAVAAGILGIITCGLISMSVGIWALIILACEDVKSAFDAVGSPAPPPAGSNSFWRIFAIVMACVILIPLAAAMIGAGAVFAAHHHASAAAPPFRELTGQELQQAGIRQESGEFRKDSNQTFPLDADGRFSIDNVDGPIEIHGWSSNAVALKIAIHGKTAVAVDAVKINVNSRPEQAEVHTDLGDHLDNGWNWLRLFGRDKATVDYIVQVPRHTQLTGVHNVDGHVAIDGVAGPITANTVDGAMDIKNAADNLNLTAVDGSISVSMDALGAGQSVSLHTVDGSITLAVPEDADANFSVHTIDGGVSSEFPELQPEKESVVGHKLKGKLGNGSAEVKAETVDGAVRLKKNRAPKPTVASAASNGATDSLGRAVSEVVTNVQDAAVAIAAAQKWLALIDAGNYVESWNQSAPVFQGAVTEAAWENSMNTFRKPLGTVLSRKLKSSEPATQLPGAPDGRYVVMQFETSFTEKKSAIETVTFNLEKDGQWKSSGYFIK